MTRYSNMTRAEAARLRNGRGKNYNGGKYDNPNAEDNIGAVIKFGLFLGWVGIVISCM